MTVLQLSCAHCGEPVRRTAREQRNAVTKGRGDRAFCSRKCAGTQAALDQRRVNERPEFGIEALSAREIECAKLAARSMSDKEIAREMRLSPNTIKIHLGNIFKKLHVTKRRDLISFFEAEAVSQTPITHEQIATFDKTSDKMRETVRLIVSGLTMLQIAKQHNVSHTTVKSRLERIREALGTRNSTSMITLWHQYEKHKQESSDECRRQHADRVSA